MQISESDVVPISTSRDLVVVVICGGGGGGVPPVIAETRRAHRIAGINRRANWSLSYLYGVSSEVMHRAWASDHNYLGE